MDKNDDALCLGGINLDNIPRCPNCNLISSLKLNYKEGKPIINFCCENNHKGEISLEEYLQKYNAYSITKQDCAECKKKQNEVKGDFSYCSQCNKFLCHSCILNHPNGDKHRTIYFTRYDSLCKEHSNSYSFYCNKCKKNLCIYCNIEHESHDVINLSKYNYSEESKNKLEELIKNIENKIKDLDAIKKDIILKIDQLKKSCEYEMKLFKILINAYKYEEEQKNLNYNIIQNLKNFEDTFGNNKAQIYDKIYKEGIKFINFLKDINDNIGQTNHFKNNIKTINNHSSSVYHLLILKDGRLASSSSDYTINIYKKNTFELQLSIKEHSNAVLFFTQLKDDRIVSCSCDNTMNIIKLINDDKYNIDQKIQGHSNYVYNVIEIRENELISVSYDKTMKKWELKNNKFECTKTINFQNSNSYCNILKLNENEFVTSSYSDKCIKFWNSNDYSNIASINDIESDWTSRNMCKLDDDILCIGGNNSKGFYLIKISTHQLIKNILGPKRIYSIYECYDGLFLCSIINENGNYAIVKYRYDNENMVKIIEKEKIHENNIYTCIEFDRGKIVATGSADNLIKLWSD